MSHDSHWNPKPPLSPVIGDHDVPHDSDHLAGKHVALLVTGGIAAMKSPMIARALRRHGAQVTAIASSEGLRYVTEDTLAWSTNRPVVTQLSPRAEHLSGSEPFDAYLVAPATYNTINKMACGIADGTVTATLASALGRLERGGCALLLCPTMHGSMHTQILSESLLRLQKLGVQVIAPRDDYGKHNLPDEEPIVRAVCRALSRSPLRGRRVLVTGGPVPAPLDAVRRISSRFTGALGIAVARELDLCGCDVDLVLGSGSIAAPAWLRHSVARDVTHYRSLVLEALERPAHAAVLSAAVADFAPREVREGKVPSGAGAWSIELQPTEKVIDAVHRLHPSLPIVGFKYEERCELDALLKLAHARAAVHGACVANRGEDTPDGGVQTAWFTAAGHDPVRITSKARIAHAVREHLERVCEAHPMAHAAQH